MITMDSFGFHYNANSTQLAANSTAEQQNFWSGTYDGDDVESWRNTMVWTSAFGMVFFLLGALSTGVSLSYNKSAWSETPTTRVEFVRSVYFWYGIHVLLVAMGIVFLTVRDDGFKLPNLLFLLYVFPAAVVSCRFAQVHAGLTEEEHSCPRMRYSKRTGTLSISHGKE